MFEVGVAAVLQGKTAPSSLLRLHALEQIIKKSQKDQRNNLPVICFFMNRLQRGVPLLAQVRLAEMDPFGGLELIG